LKNRVISGNFRQVDSNMMRLHHFFFISLLPLMTAQAWGATADFTLDFETDAERAESSFFDADSSPPRSPVRWKDYFGQHPSLKNLNLGIKMGGKEALEKNVSTPMLPASVEKLFTASAALHFLGPEMRFENSFSGDLDDTTSVLSHPRFRISGDPTWGSEYFEGVVDGSDLQHNEALSSRLQAVIHVLKQNGVTQVQGPIEIESLRPKLADEARPAGWKPEWNLQCMAQLQTEFEANGNCGLFKITSPTRYGWVTHGVTLPVRVNIYRSKSGQTALKVTPKFDPKGRIIQYAITGSIGRVPIEYALPVHQGREWLKNLFIKALNDASISYVETPGIGLSSFFLRSLQVDLSSKPLLDILRIAVQNSINGVMDRIFLEVGYFFQDAPQTVTERYLASLIKNETLMQGVLLKDGSGLNIQDRIRADTLYAYLSALRDQSYFTDLMSTLAVAGKSGTLHHRATLANSPYTNGKIYGKICLSSI
jgi:D-alanyl-D-alanine carboxypeptidase/D-alanyl-D-alanine-endopeptidase (penicillin-binding protein 4)